MFQTIDSNNITIEDDIKLPNLISFEIHGNDMATRIYITDKMFKSIKNIKYVNIQNVSFDKLTLENNEPSPIIDSKVYRKENAYAFNELVPVLPVYLHKENNVVKNSLIFLQPKDVDMVPYETYKKTRKRRAKSNSIFLNNKNLLFLRITNCGLKDISWDLFNGLESLETLILDNNAIEYIPDFSFYGASVLKSLSLANNKIKQLQTTGLAGLLDLQYLNLKNNALNVLSESTFPPLPKLKVADLSKNPIETVYPNTFEVLNATVELTLGSNDTQLYLHQNAFVGLDSLEILRLINVNLTVLDRTQLIGLPKLVELNIKGTVDHIAFDAFVEIPNVKRIVLSNCSIRSVSMDSFYGIYNLEHLDLSYNRLRELPPGLFDNQFSLKELILNNNQLIDLADGIFKTVSNVKLIRLDMNPLRCTCGMKSWDVSLMTKTMEKTKKQFCEWDHLKKGYGCTIKMTTAYMYNKKFEPMCSSPEKFNGKTVSYVLRKYLNCDSKPYGVNPYMKKKYKEFKQYKLLGELNAGQKAPKNSTLTLDPNSTNASAADSMANITKNAQDTVNNTNMTSKVNMETANGIDYSAVNSTSESIINTSTSERTVLLKNGTYISKSSLKEEISKINKINKLLNSNAQNKL